MLQNVSMFHSDICIRAGGGISVTERKENIVALQLATEPNTVHQ